MAVESRFSTQLSPPEAKIRQNPSQMLQEREKEPSLGREIRERNVPSLARHLNRPAERNNGRHTTRMSGAVASVLATTGGTLLMNDEAIAT